MKLLGMLSAGLLLAAPVAAVAQGHGGMGGGMAGGAGHGGVTQVSMVRGGASFGPGHGPARGGFHGHGFDGHDHGFHDHGFHDHFHNHGLLLGWGPYWGWGWPDCSAYGDACSWGDESSADDPSDDYGHTDGPAPNAACGAWLRHGAGYVWTRRICGDAPAADPPSHAAVASNECSDWVWRADLRRSVCKRASHAEG
jgi:hypothetical protein